MCLTPTSYRLVEFNPFKHPYGSHINIDTKQISVNCVLGVNMLDALHQSSLGIDGGETYFFRATGAKFMYRIDIPGYPVFRQQKYAMSAKRIPITIETAVRQVAQVMHAFIEQAARQVSTDGLMRFGPGCLELKDLYLVELRRFGATIQPVFAYIEPGAVFMDSGNVYVQYGSQ
ncbi:hypothetical protein PHLGIDRAFT_413528 [Phlebiopsis gigantea 11061_1 CR5-6]|uniref:Uncharacterized protein n=1 Tax=Phlebiopsis gigantea (strain 11061_1 CR5-6) TaxID=745531 RepID=A0A0C3PLZ3_PHLG1|nr:hypothetical protein PHLGIDRAFT_413528 [Phlebiopsis gigantea 11061_1 CR5-6]